MIMLVILDVPLRIREVKSELLQQLEYVTVQRDVRFAHEYALVEWVGIPGHLSEPRMAFDVLSLVPLGRVGVEDTFHEVLALTGHKFRNLEVSVKDLLVKLGGVGVLERQVATHEGTK